ncbi:50S ribosomal protein L4 [Candidatus Wirthbacteria bacterium CG2_30_54_11]|uniref:Large ribosomal subunit protein uL4 n=1 Tax=Candidatus Wirthbacteria bacterium CG2_30_54_11 TaxID=1817892 RepID=A0A1J5ITX1_9BACT|nr:ribosomal protein L4 [uncultured bacterium]OIQ00557.1 MAG: 50S ribosomal protein L4 [Candidatus Wirthbacteria bacterium CG2_30_54_11]
MSKIDLYNAAGEKSGTIKLPEHIFNVDVNYPLIAQAVHVYLDNQRKRTANTKLRGDVRGGGRKPWKQKGTGRARQGSIRSAQWRGGGIIFGPSAYKPRLGRLNRKMRQAALCSAFSLKAKEQSIIVLEDLDAKISKTKDAVKLLGQLPMTNKSLILLSEPAVETVRALKNIPTVEVNRFDNLNVHSIMSHKTIVITKKGLKQLTARYPEPEKAKKEETKESKDSETKAD